MKFGCQTILWGIEPYNMERMLDYIADCGYEGVEFFQHPDVLTAKLGDIEALRAHCERRKLTILGFSGGPIDDRVSYLRGWKAPYVYLDSWDARAPGWLAEGYRLAVHPHYLKKGDSELTGDKMLKQHDFVVVLDTAHAALRRESMTRLLSQHWKRLAAVHITDWRPGFGRVSPMYARGFTEIGNGSLSGKEIPEVLEFLTTRGFDGFAVVEQYYSEGVIEESVLQSARWLAETKFMKPGPGQLTAQPQMFNLAESSGSAPTLSFGDPDFPVALQDLACRDVGQLYNRISDEVLRHLGKKCLAVALWSFSELDQVFALQSLRPIQTLTQELMTVIESGFAASAKAVWVPFTDAPVAEAMATALPRGAAGRWRIPVRSSWNPNQCRLMLDLFAAEPGDIQLDTIHHPFVARAVRKAFDAQMDKIALSVTADLNEAIVGTQSLLDLCREIRRITKKRLNCEAVALFIADRSKTRLSPVPADGLLGSDRQPKNDGYYEIGDGQLTTKIWQSGEPAFLGRDGSQHLPLPSKFLLDTETPSENRVLSMPVVDTARDNVGLVRCANKKGGAGGVCNFSDDDLVILDGLLQQAIPAIRLRQSELYKSEELTEISHELKRPIAALRGVLFTMRNEFAKRGVSFGHDYMGDAVAWGNLLSAVIRQLDYSNLSPKPRFERVLVIGDILAPTVTQLHWQLREAGFPPERISYEGWRMIPAIYADPNMLQQVFFNLFDNAIKYADPDRMDQFRVKVICSDEGDAFRFRVQDWGIGIPSGMKESIFNKGVRGPDEEVGPIFGTGLGLWIVQRLVKLHGGRISVTRLSNPTEFTLDLPRSLERPPERKPERKYQELT
ncbi:MAG: hypothetical protein JNK87_00630 [Bryobacterales bacterium]|nr:hypothetical protein [Bryobacterales bacterium]